MVVILFAPCVITLVHHREQIAISCWPNVVALRTTTLATAGKAEATKTKKRRRIILVWTRKKVLDTTSEQACNNTFEVWSSQVTKKFILSHQLFFPLCNLKILVPFVTNSELKKKNWNFSGYIQKKGCWLKNIFTYIVLLKKRVPDATCLLNLICSSIVATQLMIDNQLD